jgi:predicted RNA-binding Zn ribbon-like protein
MTMPESLDLIGGHVAVDLVNTVWWRGDDERRRDSLSDFPTLVAWSARVQLLDASTALRLTRIAADAPRRAERALVRVRRLRESLHAVMVATIAQRRPSPVHLKPLYAAMVEAVGHTLPNAELPLRWQVRVESPESFVRSIALQVLAFLQSTDVERLRACEDQACGWLFVDRSRNHRRRWCSSAICGNRARARRHYRRQRLRI